MKKGWKLLIAVVLLLVVIAALLLVLNKTGNDGKKESTQAVSQTAVKDIEGITYSSESTGGKDVSLVRRKNVWYYADDEEFPIDQEYVTEHMATVAAEAVASRTLDNPSDDLGEYGLDNPATKITLTKTDGSKVCMSIGSYNESVEGYYLKIDGDKKIYLVDGQMVFAFDMSIYEIADKEDYPVVEESSFTHIKIEKQDKTVEFKGEVKEDTTASVTKDHYLEKQKTWSVASNGGNYAEGDQTEITSLISTLAGLGYSKMIAYKADEETRKSYGLDDSAIRMTIDYQVLDETTAREVELSSGITEIQCDTLDKQYILYIGNEVPEDGFSDSEYYVYVDGADSIYTMSAEDLSSIVEINAASYK